MSIGNHPMNRPWAVVFVFILFCTVNLAGQTGNLKNSVAISYSAMSFSANTFTKGVEQYLGAGLEYRIMPKPWFGFEAQATKFPQTQSAQDAVSGGTVFLANANLLAGHRWRKAGVFAEVGGGYFHTGIYKGFILQSNQATAIYTTRNYPDLQTGGLVEVWLGRRWSVTFEVRDNFLFIAPYDAVFAGAPNRFPGGTINPVEGRSGVAFHF